MIYEGGILQVCPASLQTILPDSNQWNGIQSVLRKIGTNVGDHPIGQCHATRHQQCLRRGATLQPGLIREAGEGSDYLLKEPPLLSIIEEFIWSDGH